MNDYVVVCTFAAGTTPQAIADLVAEEQVIAARLQAAGRLGAVGAPIDAEDLKACKAVLRDPIDVSWNGAQVALASGLTAGPTFRRVLENLPAGGVARFYGTAKIYKSGPVYDQVWTKLIQPEKDRDPEKKGFAVLISVERVEDLGGKPVAA